jgi:hypothetical protein
MNKTLKFNANLVSSVLDGSKNSTWRLWDEKNLSEGDVVDLLGRPTLEKFATAKLTKVITKKFKDLTPEDRKGHEQFDTDQQMLETYSKDYKKPVTMDTEVKIMWFELLT